MELDKILLGDCYELIRQVPDKSVDLIVTDPPYDVGGFKGGGMLQEKGIKAMFDRLKDKNLVNGFDLSILAEFDRAMRKPNIYIWCSKRQIYPLMSYYIPKEERDGGQMKLF